jgi:hypothetical protein
MWQNLWQVGLVIAGVLLTVHLAIETATMAWDVYESRHTKRLEVEKTHQKSPGESPIGDPLSRR